MERSLPPTIFRNPARRPTLRPRALHPADDPLPFHRSIPGYAPTRLVSAGALAGELGLEDLLIKVESERFGLPAFKMLGASWGTFRLLSSVLRDRDLRPPPVPDLAELRERIAPLRPLSLVAATDGNHGRAVARMASLLGCSSRIFVPAETAAARIEAIRHEGAEVTEIAGTYDDAVVEAASIAADDTLVVSDTSWDGYVDVPNWVIDGYRTIFSELEDQTRTEALDIVALQMGVGALAAAAVDALGAEPSIVIVEPTRAACGLRSAERGAPTEVPGPHDSIMAGLNCGNVSPVAWPRVSAGAELFVAVEDHDAVQAMRDLARAGVVAGETGAAGLAGLRAVLQAGQLEASGKRALVICTEGATDPAAYESLVGAAPKA